MFTSYGSQWMCRCTNKKTLYERQYLRVKDSHEIVTHRLNLVHLRELRQKIPELALLFMHAVWAYDLPV